MIEKEIAIKVENVSKTFRIPHERISTLRGAFVNAFGDKGYEEFKALDGVSFEVKKGEFFGIVGRNGSGKSTLLKILAGIYQPDKGGSVRVNGRISPFLELGIGFQQELSGRDNVHLNATVLGLSKKQIAEKFDAIVGFSELERFIDQKIKNYSSGMQVRLAFSVAVHANRNILLMDEVLAVGDANFQQKCLEEFNKYKKEGKTVLLVTHDTATVQRYCDRAMLLRNGLIEAIGKPEEVINKYVHQNISDEERRTTEKTDGPKRKDGLPEPAKKAEIKKVVFLGKDGEEKNIFATGEDITMRIFYSVREKISKPMIGLAIFTQDGIQISGPNTRTSGFKLESIEGEGKIDFVIRNNQLYSGAYDFTVAIHDWEGIIPYDFKDKAFSIKVISGEENQYGLLKLDHEWKKPE